MKKSVKYIVLVLIVGLLFYNSVYIESLDKFKESKVNKVYDAKSIASKFMSNDLEDLPAINASEFLTELSKNLNNYCEQKGKKLGISKDYNFIIQGKGTVLSVEDENVMITLNENPEQKILIATDFIFGNAIRDGSGIANVGDFQNTMDFNNISVELNNIVRETIVPPFKRQVKEGDTLTFKGAVKVNTKNPNLNNLKVIPLILKLNN